METKRDLKALHLPRNLLSDPAQARREGEALLQEWPALEAAYSEWEATQERWFLDLLPWAEGRREHNRLKALGEVPEVRWWEVLAFVERVFPTRMFHMRRWGKEVNNRPSDVRKMLSGERAARDRAKRRLKKEQAAALSSPSSPISG